MPLCGFLSLQIKLKVYALRSVFLSVQVNALTVPLWVEVKYCVCKNYFGQDCKEQKQNRQTEFLTAFNYSKLQPEPVLWLKMERKKKLHLVKDV